MRPVPPSSPRAIPASTVAEPPWFAVPLDGREDERSVTLTFHLSGNESAPVNVHATEEGVTLWGKPRGGQRRVRLCALLCAVEPTGLEARRSGDILTVSIPKKPSGHGTPSSPAQAA